MGAADALAVDDERLDGESDFCPAEVAETETEPPMLPPSALRTERLRSRTTSGVFFHESGDWVPVEMETAMAIAGEMAGESGADSEGTRGL